MNWKRVFLRSWFYFRIGYSTYLAFPVALLGYISAIYYLLIKSISLLNAFFSSFIMFIMFTLFIILPLGILLGWMHFKKTPMFGTEQTIAVESNPFTTTQLTPLQIPIWKLFRELAKERGLTNIVVQMDEIIRRSES